jgi:hypothetical protein
VPFNVARLTIHNDKLPEDVLLEIFDAYQQLYKIQPDYETLWNSRDGWFKLTHVCLRWRRVVFLASSRLHLHLLFTPHRSSRVTMLRCLPRFPIFIDYRAASWEKKEQDLALAAIRHRGRVRGIALRSPFPVTLLCALSHPFPELESLEICSTQNEMLLPSTILSGSAPCLRQLTLRDIAPRCISPLLSSATALVELVLTLRVAYRGPPEASLITNLQRMSCLRRLELKLNFSYLFMAIIPFSPPPPASAGDVPLSSLTDLIFMGPSPYLQMLVAGLAAPSLQHLDADVCDTGRPLISPIPHLCKFICDTECQFIAVRLGLDFLQGKLKFSAETRSKSNLFRITIPDPYSESLEEMGNILSGPLSTVKEFVFDVPPSPSTTQRPIRWHAFFNHIQQAKFVQVPSQVALDVAHSFQLDGQGPVLDLLPALEQVKVHLTYLPPIGTTRHDQNASICRAFEPLIAARKQVGRPIILSWA